MKSIGRPFLIILLVLILAVLLTGCVNLDSLVTKINEPGAAWSIERKTPCGGYVRISRVNPMLGVSQAVTEKGLTATMPTNMGLQISYVVPTPAPVSTSQPTKGIK